MGASLTNGAPLIPLLHTSARRARASRDITWIPIMLPTPHAGFPESIPKRDPCPAQGFTIWYVTSHAPMLKRTPWTGGAPLIGLRHIRPCLIKAPLDTTGPASTMLPTSWAGQPDAVGIFYFPPCQRGTGLHITHFSHMSLTHGL